MKLLLRRYILSIKKIYILILCLTSTLLICNPFKNGGDNRPPAVRSSRSPIPEEFVELQIEFRDKIANLIVEVKDRENLEPLLMLLVLGFIYGVLHAAGPGHRKTVLFSTFLSNNSRWWEPGITGLLSAFLHGISGVLLIVILKEFSMRLLSTRVDLVSNYMETGSFILLLILALYLTVGKIIKVFTKKPSKVCEKKSRGAYYTVLITSLFPCPGAILILILSLSLDVLGIGVLTVMALSIGMGITISITAYLGRAGRVGIFKTLKSNREVIGRVSNSLELLGYLFLLLFSVWMVLPLLA